MRCVVCVLISTPLVFIAGSHRVRPLQQTYGATREVPRVEDEAVGPTGLVGRPGWSADQPVATAPNLLLVGCLGLPCLIHAGIGLY